MILLPCYYIIKLHHNWKLLINNKNHYYPSSMRKLKTSKSRSEINGPLVRPLNQSQWKKNNTCMSFLREYINYEQNWKPKILKIVCLIFCQSFQILKLPFFFTNVLLFGLWSFSSNQRPINWLPLVTIVASMKFEIP